ncbi:thioesterase II family protein [Streptacidiphilus sp. PAMC 29251]
MPVLDPAESSDHDVQVLLELGGGSPAELAGRPQWRRTMLGILRDDLQLARSLRAGAGAVLSTPLLACAGFEDRIAPVADVEQWSRYAAQSFRLRTLPGGHFFVRDPELPDLIAAELSELLQLAPRS